MTETGVPQGETVIRTDGLTKQYRDVTAVANMSMRVYQGEVFGLLGPNGAGTLAPALQVQVRRRRSQCCLA